MRILGLDLGSRRIGVAVSDSEGTVASPYEVIERSGDPAADRARIAALVSELDAERVVVGMPRSLDGTMGPAAQAAEAEAAALGELLAVPVDTYDERLTTVAAERSLRELRMKAKSRKRVVDKVAAAVMLQGWLERRANNP